MVNICWIYCMSYICHISMSCFVLFCFILFCFIQKHSRMFRNISKCSWTFMNIQKHLCHPHVPKQRQPCLLGNRILTQCPMHCTKYSGQPWQPPTFTHHSTSPLYLQTMWGLPIHPSSSRPEMTFVFSLKPYPKKNLMLVWASGRHWGRSWKQQGISCHWGIVFGLWGQLAGLHGQCWGQFWGSWRTWSNWWSTFSRQQVHWPSVGRHTWRPWHIGPKGCPDAKVLDCLSLGTSAFLNLNFNLGLRL